MKEEIHTIIITALNRLDDKLDKVKEDTTDIRVVQIKNTDDIKYHIKRTDILETKVDHLMKLDNRVKWTISILVALGSIAVFLKNMNII